MWLKYCNYGCNLNHFYDILYKIPCQAKAGIYTVEGRELFTAFIHLNWFGYVTTDKRGIFQNLHDIRTSSNTITESHLVFKFYVNKGKLW